MTNQQNKNNALSDEVEKVLNYVKDQLYSGRLSSGDRLPAERKLAENLGVSRAHVRCAFQKLEFYGLAKTYPQSGTVVTQMKLQQMENIFTDMLKIDRYDFSSLVDVRLLLEVEAARLAALNRDENDLQVMKAAMDECEKQFGTEEQVPRDFEFHQSVARAARNPVMSSLMLIITPDVLKYYQKYKVCAVPREDVLREHQELYNCIANHDCEGAMAVVRQHLAALLDFSQTHKKSQLPLNK